MLVTLLGLLGVLVVLFVGGVLATRDTGLLRDVPLDRSPVAGAGDLEGVRFSLALRGYRMSEVDEVLDRAGAALAAAQNQLAQTCRELEQARRELDQAGAGRGPARAVVPAGGGGRALAGNGEHRHDRAMSVSLELTVPVQAPAEQVFAGATDWAGQSEWMLGTQVEATDQQGREVGGGISAFTGVRTPFGRIGFLDTMVITRWDPPIRCDVLHTGRVVRGTGIFSVVPRGPQQADFVWREDLVLPLGLLGRVAWVLVKPLFAAGVLLSLKRFARWVEAGGAAAAPGRTAG